MKKGILSVVIFYGLGLVLTWLTYKIFGAGYGHGPGLYILIPFLTLLIGLFWTGTTIFNFFFKNRTDKRKGVIYANGVVLLISIGTIFYIRKISELPDIGTADNLNAEQSGDTTSIHYNGTMIYLKVKDSVYIDKRDSVTGTLK